MRLLAVPAMNWATGEGFVTGRSETFLAPQDSAARAETAVVLVKFLEWMKNR